MSGIPAGTIRIRPDPSGIGIRDEIDYMFYTPVPLQFEANSQPAQPLIADNLPGPRRARDMERTGTGNPTSGKCSKSRAWDPSIHENKFSLNSTAFRLVAVNERSNSSDIMSMGIFKSTRHLSNSSSSSVQRSETKPSAVTSSIWRLLIQGGLKLVIRGRALFKGPLKLDIGFSPTGNIGNTPWILEFKRRGVPCRAQGLRHPGLRATTNDYVFEFTLILKSDRIITGCN